MSKDTHKMVLESGKTYYGISVNGRGYSEGIKASNLRDVVVNGFNVVGGDEDCIDIVRGGGYLFVRGDMYAGDARTYVTVKGGVNGFVMDDVVLYGKPKYWWDISLGDHTIYNDADADLPITRGVVLNDVRRANGRPVRILCVAAERPDLCRGNYRVYVVPKWIWRLWFWLKRKKSS